MKKFGILILVLLSVSCTQTSSKEKTEAVDDTAVNDSVKTDLIFYPVQIGKVNDFGGLMSFEEQVKLDSIIKWYDRKTQNDLAIVTTDSIPPHMDVLTYASKLGNRYEIGGTKNNGLIIYVNAKVGKMAIAPGRKLEKAYNDSVCKYVLDQKMAPSFNQNNFFEGFKNGIHSLGVADSLRAN